jgi:hypothetical protein
MAIQDDILITVLDDGSVKIETPKVSSANHTSAEAFLRELERMLGGQSVRVRKGNTHSHTHKHGDLEHKH